MRLRLQFSESLVTPDMELNGLQKSWYETSCVNLTDTEERSDECPTIAQLAQELVDHFSLPVTSASDLQLRQDGFVMPQSSRMSLLRDGDLLEISFCVSGASPLGAAGSFFQADTGVTAGVQQLHGSTQDISAGSLLSIGQAIVSSDQITGQRPSNQDEDGGDDPVDEPPAASWDNLQASDGTGCPSEGGNCSTWSRKNPLLPCFVCQSLSSPRDPVVKVRFRSMREHIGYHILSEDVPSDCCGFCGRTDGGCHSYMDRGAKGAQVPTSNCPYFLKFRIKNTSSISTTNDDADDKCVRRSHLLCSNVPTLCSACLSPAYVWKYDMIKHWEKFHKEILDAGEMPPDYIVSEVEKALIIKASLSMKTKRNEEQLLTKPRPALRAMAMTQGLRAQNSPSSSRAVKSPRVDLGGLREQHGPGATQTSQAGQVDGDCNVMVELNPAHTDDHGIENSIKSFDHKKNDESSSMVTDGSTQPITIT